MTEYIYKKNYLIIFIFFCIFFSTGVFAKSLRLGINTFNRKKYISIYDLIKKLGTDNSFDIILRRGKLYNRNHYSVYIVGFSYILIDGELYKSGYPVYQYRGEIFLPLYSGKLIINNLYPEYSLTINDNNLNIKYKKKVLPVKTAYKSNTGKNVKDKIGFIIIDPGHGGKDPGAIGKGGIKEKTITLKIAKQVKKILRKKLKGIRISLTRRKNSFIELAERTSIANRKLRKGSNGIFISIHVNASLSKKISGYETYFLSQNPTNEESRNTAALENNVIVLEDNMNKKRKNFQDIDYIEATMLTTQIQKESSLLAKLIQYGMKKKIVKFKSRGVRKADFFVLRGALMPAVLVEIGFITNRKEARYLKKRNHQSKIARGIANGVIMFLKKYNRTIK